MGLRAARSYRQEALFLPGGTQQWHRSGGKTDLALLQKDPVSLGCVFQHSLPGEIKIAESNTMLPAASEELPL